MKKSKFLRLVAVLMTVALLLGMLPATALAEGGNELPIQTVLGFSTTPTTITAQNVPAGFQWHFAGETEWYTSLVRSGLYPNTEYKIEYISTANSTPTTKNVTTDASQSHTDKVLIDSAAPNTVSYTQYSATFSLENDLTYSLYLKAAKYENNSSYPGIFGSNYRIYVEHEVYDTATSSYKWEASIIAAAPNKVFYNNADRYVFKIPGLAAAQLNDNLNITLYFDNTLDGKTYITPICNTTMKTTAYSILNSATTTEKKTLVADFINYCAACQTYFKYNDSSDKLVNKDLGANASYATTTAPTLTNILARVGTKDPSAPISFTGTGLSVASKITWTISFNSTLQSNSGLKLKLSYESVSGDTVNLTIPASGSTFYVSSIAAADFSTPFTFAAYVGDERVSDTYTCNVETSALRFWDSDKNKDLIEAMMKYSYSAKAFFSVAK